MKTLPPPPAVPIRLGGIALVALAALAFGWPTLDGDFLSGDDQRFIIEHYLVNHPSPENAARLFAILHDDLYQPLPMLSFQMDYARSVPTPDSRYPVSARAFHETNLALHVMCSVLAALVATRLAGCRRIGVITGLMFGCHPFALEPVAWIGGRMVLLATLFSLTTMLACFALRSSRPQTEPAPTGVAQQGDPSDPLAPRLTVSPVRLTFAEGAAYVSWLLSLLSKVLPTVPLAPLFADWQLQKRVASPARRVYAILIVLSIAATGMVYAATQRAGFVEGVDIERTTPLPLHVLLALGYYLRNYVLPGSLAAWSPPPEQVAIGSPAALVAFGEAAVFIALLALTRRRNPSAFLGLVLFAILLAPFLLAGAGRRFLAADRYMYLPILGLHLSVAAMAIALLDRLATRLPQPHARVAVGVPVLLVLAAWLTAAWRLAPSWRDTIRRDLRVAQVYPDSPLAHAELAKAFNFMEDPEESIRVVEAARKRWPYNPRLAAAIGESYRMLEDWPRAKDELQFAASRMPRHLITHYRLGQVYEKLDQHDRARVEFEHVLTVAPSYLPARMALARSYQATGNIDKAAEHYEIALGINPRSRNARFSLAEIRIRQFDWPAAEHLLRELLRTEPDDGPARLNLAVALANQNRGDEALAIYDALAAQQPENSIVRVNRASILASRGDAAAAERDYRAVLANDPGHADAAIGLHIVLLEQRRYAELPGIWEAYRAAVPDDQRTIGWQAWADALSNQLNTSDDGTRWLHLHDPFLGWAMAWDAIKSGDTLTVRKRLGPPEVPDPVTPEKRQEMRAILSALDSLPEAAKESPIGVYALARAALHGGDVPLARSAAERVVALSDDDVHRDGARLILEAINSVRPGGSPASQSAPRLQD